MTGVQTCALPIYTFFLQILDKQHLRLKGAFDRHIVSELTERDKPGLRGGSEPANQNGG